MVYHYCITIWILNNNILSLHPPLCVCVYNDTAIRKGKVTFCLVLIDMHTQTYSSVKDTHSPIFSDIFPVRNWLGHTLQSQVPLLLTHCIADLAPCGHKGLSLSSWGETLPFTSYVLTEYSYVVTQRSMWTIPLLEKTRPQKSFRLKLHFDHYWEWNVIPNISKNLIKHTDHTAISPPSLPHLMYPRLASH